MKLCSIVPTSWLGKVPLYSSTHLILAQEVQKTPRYKDFYRKRCIEGDYIIVDNGAFEKEDVDMHGVLQAAHDVYVPRCGGVEVVAPEVMGDIDASVSKLREFIGLQIKLNITYFRQMVVLQGANDNEAYEMFKLVHPHMKDLKVSYGIPKYLGAYRQRIITRVLTDPMLNLNEVPKIHALGVSGGEDRRLSSNLIRSMDTSYPATISLLNLPPIPHDGKLVSPARPDNFFGQPEPTHAQYKAYCLSYGWLRDTLQADAPTDYEDTEG